MSKLRNLKTKGICSKRNYTTSKELKYLTALVKSRSRIRSREGKGKVVLRVPIEYVPTKQGDVVEEASPKHYIIEWRVWGRGHK